MTGLIGSLCSGYEGLGLAVTEVIGGELAWVADNDKGAAAILAHRFPGVPNLGDIKEIDWAHVTPVEVLLGGFPCQDISCAGGRTGLRAGNRTGLWSHIALAIGVLRPSLVVLENVRGLLSGKTDGNLEWCPWCLGDTEPELALRALGAVLGDLADLGFDADWVTVSASDVGAPHLRERVFIVAYPADASGRELLRHRVTGDVAGKVGRPAGTGLAAAGDAAGPGGADAADAERPRVRGRRPGDLAGAQGAAEGDGPERERLRPDDVAGSDGAVQDPDGAAGSERREPAPGQEEGGRPRADAGGSGGASAAADAARPRGGRPRQRVVDDDPGGDRAVPDRADAGPDGESRGAAADARREHGDGRQGAGHHRGPAAERQQAVDRADRRSSSQDDGIQWGPYEPAIRRWEQVHGRPAPRPVEPGRTGERLNPRFVEWMMGLPDGWVTDVPGLSRNAQLKALGNGVVPQQAAMALRILLADVLERAA